MTAFESSPRDIQEIRLERERGEVGAPEYRPRPWPAVEVHPLASCAACGRGAWTPEEVQFARIHGCRP